MSIVEIVKTMLAQANHMSEEQPSMTGALAH